MKVSVIGLGKLGVCVLASLTARGIKVIGYDINKKTMDTLSKGIAPVVEPELHEHIIKGKKNISVSSDFNEIIKNTDVSIFVLPTPSKSDGSFTDEYLKSAIQPIALALKNSKKKYHLFVVASTLSPGTMDKSIIPFIVKNSGRKLNKGFGVCYNPVFIALGSVIRDYLNPSLLLIGESDKKAGDIMVNIYKKVLNTKPHYGRMSIVSAEIAKISLNSYITMKISFANTLSTICENIPNSNVDDITKALGADKRISPYYLKGGLPFAGPCFPRDNRAFAVFAKEYGCEANLAVATDEVNDTQVNHITDLIVTNVLKTRIKKVAVIGLAYKKDTNVLDESPAIKVIKLLLKKKIKVLVYDPLAIDNTRKVFGHELEYLTGVKECFKESQLICIFTAFDEIKNINNSYIKHNPTTIIDCWRAIDTSKLKNIKYIALGKASK